MAANALSKYLNVKSGRLLDEYHVRYENKVRHEGRRITLTYDAEKQISRATAATVATVKMIPKTTVAIVATVAEGSRQHDLPRPPSPSKIRRV